MAIVLLRERDIDPDTELLVVRHAGDILRPRELCNALGVHRQLVLRIGIAEERSLPLRADLLDPLLAPLLDFTRPQSEPNWYLRVFDPGQHLRTADDVATLCAAHEPLARTLLERAWDDPGFRSNYARWTIELLAGQKHYHQTIAINQHALLHRVHGLNTWLFGLTALGALTHLLLHTLWLSLITTFFPALGASLHGALAQSEAYRLGATSERLVVGLQGAIARIEAAMPGAGAAGMAALKASIEAALALILEEHQDWHMLVRPHHLPLA